MKTLLILRHAKSSWKRENLADHDRPLNKRGKRDAPRIGLLLREQALMPDLIISSTAKRARKTAAEVASNSGYQGTVKLSGELYLASPQQYVQVLQDVDDACETVMVVGHNPGLEMLLEMLTGRDEPLPTAALAQIALQVESWSRLEPATPGTLIELWRPKEL